MIKTRKAWQKQHSIVYISNKVDIIDCEAWKIIIIKKQKKK